MKKKLTIIIPTYNVEQYIEKALNSIYNQQNINLEQDVQVLIVDDGSTDQTATIIKKWLLLKNNPSFQYIKKTNSNWGSVINYVKNNKLIKGEYVSILDADDFYTNICFQEVFKISHLNKYDLIISNFKRINEKEKTKSTKVIYSFKSKEISKSKSFTPWSIPLCKFFKTNLFYQLEDLKEKVSYQDQILFFSQLIKANKIYFIKNNLGFYFVARPNSSSVVDWNKERIEVWMENMNQLLSYNIPQLSAYVNMMVNYCYINTKDKENKKYIVIKKEYIDAFKSSKFTFLPKSLEWIAKIWFSLVTKKIKKG